MSQKNRQLWWHKNAPIDHVARGTLQRLYNLQRIHKEVHLRGPGSIPGDDMKIAGEWTFISPKYGNNDIDNNDDNDDDNDDHDDDDNDDANNDNDERNISQ